MTGGPHLTPEGISAAAEGLLSEADQRAAEAHLAGCERCQSAQEELLGLHAVLRQAGAEPVPMPDVVAHRLQSALDAESAERGRQDGVLSMGSSIGRARRSKHAAPSKARRRLVPALAAAAGVAAIAVGGTLGVQGLLGGGTAGDTTAGQPSTSSEESGESNDQPAQAGPSDTYLIAGSPQLTSEDFDAGVRDSLRPSTGSLSPAAPSAKAGEEDGQEGVAPKVESGTAANAERCAEVTAGENGARKVMDVQPASFDGEPALLAIAKSGRSGAVDAYVVTGCPSSGSVAHHDTVTVDR